MFDIKPFIYLLRQFDTSPEMFFLRTGDPTSWEEKLSVLSLTTDRGVSEAVEAILGSE